MLLTFQIDPQNHEAAVSFNAHYIESIAVASTDFTIVTTSGHRWTLPLTDVNKDEYDQWCAFVG